MKNNKILLATLSLTSLLAVSTMVTSCGNNTGNNTTDGSQSVSESTSSGNSSSESDSNSETQGGGSFADFVVPEGGYDGSEVTVKFYHTMGDNLQQAMAPYLEQFKTMYPNITVEHESIGGYDDVRDQIKTELSVGDGPSMAYVYPDHVALYNKTQRVVRLDNLINDPTYGISKEVQDDFIQGYWNEGREFGDGYMYTLPFSKSTEVLYYNKTFFEANNLEVPTHWFSTGENDTTSMEYVCAKIKSIDPNSIPLGYDSESNWFITMTEQIDSPYTSATAENKEDHFLFDNELNRSFVQNFKNWYDKGYVTTQKIYGAYTSGLFVSTELQKSYMSIGSSAGATHQRPKKVGDSYPWEVGIAPIPQDDPTEPKVISQGPSICLFNKGDSQEVMASWLLAKFLTTSVAFQAEFSMASGYVPVLNSVSENETYSEFLNSADGGDNIAALSAKVCMEQKDAYYTSPAFIGSSEARDQVGDLLVAVMTGNKTVSEAFEDAVKECIANS